MIGIALYMGDLMCKTPHVFDRKLKCSINACLTDFFC